jgi:hypothetical protein
MFLPHHQIPLPHRIKARHLACVPDIVVKLNPHPLSHQLWSTTVARKFSWLRRLHRKRSLLHDLGSPFGRLISYLSLKNEVAKRILHL